MQVQLKWWDKQELLCIEPKITEGTFLKKLCLEVCLFYKPHTNNPLHLSRDLINLLEKFQ